MKKFNVFSLICILSGFMVIACQRDRGVYAGNESDTYQPRPAPVLNTSSDVKGELIRVDMAGKMIAVRVENGMEQTFKFDDNTTLKGLDGQPPASPAQAGKTNASPLRNLAGKEGSEVTVQWHDDSGARMATNIDVTQVSTSHNTRRAGKKR